MIWGYHCFWKHPYVYTGMDVLLCSSIHDGSGESARSPSESSLFWFSWSSVLVGKPWTNSSYRFGSSRCPSILTWGYGSYGSAIAYPWSFWGYLRPCLNMFFPKKRITKICISDPTDPLAQGTPKRGTGSKVEKSSRLHRLWHPKSKQNAGHEWKAPPTLPDP